MTSEAFIRFPRRSKTEFDSFSPIIQSGIHNDVLETEQAIRRRRLESFKNAIIQFIVMVAMTAISLVLLLIVEGLELGDSWHQDLSYLL